MKTIAVVFVILATTLVEGRHIHPGHEKQWNVDDADVIPMNVLYDVKLNRFVPINNALFFKFSEPCEKGYKRDAVGVCREVWD